jgi:hypothetical protein
MPALLTLATLGNTAQVEITLVAKASKMVIFMT